VGGGANTSAAADASRKDGDETEACHRILFLASRAPHSSALYLAAKESVARQELHDAVANDERCSYTVVSLVDTTGGQREMCAGAELIQQAEAAHVHLP
jgi:hypothetical protein